MPCLIKISLEGSSKKNEYNHSYIDIPIYNEEIVSLPNIISSIKTSDDKTKVTINLDLVKNYEILTENIRFKKKKGKEEIKINLDLEQCKVIIYPKKDIFYRDQRIDCYAVLIWHINHNLLEIIDRSCRF